VNQAHPLSITERQLQIVDLIAQKQRITVSEIASLFGVSEATARRDLESLADRHLVQRVHGGAITTPSAPRELPLPTRANEQREEKMAIARFAASLIQDGETIFLGSGTTVHYLAEQLHERHLTVITNSLPVINTLAGEPHISLIVLGGSFRPEELSFIGHITEQALVEVRADRVFMGIRAIDLQHGLTNDYLPETLTDRAILRIGKQVVILADHTKMGRIAGAFVAPLDAIHLLITDASTPASFLSALRDQGLRVEVAPL
jgi:DeoR family transcriptional regulator of aga operon